MAWFSKKKPADPLTARERELQKEIARLQREVGRLAHDPPPPVTVTPGSSSTPSRPYAPPLRPTSVVPPAEVAPAHLNEFGAAKFDIRAAWARWASYWGGPTSNNPRMAKMLAAGSIQGLRTLRYERRVARNRFIALFVILLVILWGLAYTYLPSR